MFFRFLLIISLSCVLPLKGAFERVGNTAYQLGLGESGLVATDEASGFWMNPCHSQNTTHFQFHLQYSNLYQIPSLQNIISWMTFPWNHFHWGIGIAQLGTSFYNESMFTLNMSKAFFQHAFYVGLNINELLLRIRNYSSLNSLTIDVGFQYRVSPRVWIGGAFQNLFHTSLGKTPEQLPANIRIGILYLPSENIHFHLLVQKDSWFAPEIHMGLSYQLTKALSIYSGYTTAGSKPSGGLRIRWKRLRFHYAFEYHFQLGSTQIVGIAVQ